MSNRAVFLALPILLTAIVSQSSRASDEKPVTLVGKLQMSGELSKAGLDLLTVRCVDFTNFPSFTDAKTNHEGEFRLALESDGAGPIGCFVLRGDQPVADLYFQHADALLQTYSPKMRISQLQLGTVSLNLRDGKALVDSRQVVEE